MTAGAAAWRLVLGTGAGGFRAGGGAAATAASGARNMAVDEVLLRTVAGGGPPTLRFYTWTPACLSLGRNQPARDLYDPGRAAAAGIDIVRRPTGGLAVLHDLELTYCVAAPLAPFGSPRAAYAGINRALVEGLRRFGVDAEQATGVRARGPLHGATEPCFQSPAAGEVIARGRKLVGSAQRCEHGALLQHGSILLSGSQARVLDLMIRPDREAFAGDGSVTLEELTGARPCVAALIDALHNGFERIFGTRLAPGRLNQGESDRAEQLVACYGGDDWTWRR